MNASANVTYQDVVKAIADLPSENWALLIEFARLLQMRHWVVMAQPQATETRTSRMRLVTHPSSDLLKWVGLISIGGDALEDSERLYE